MKIHLNLLNIFPFNRIHTAYLGRKVRRIYERDRRNREAGRLPDGMPRWMEEREERRRAAMGVDPIFTTQPDVVVIHVSEMVQHIDGAIENRVIRINVDDITNITHINPNSCWIRINDNRSIRLNHSAQDIRQMINGDGSRSASI